MKRIIIVVPLGIVLFFASCQKETNPIPDPANSIKEMQVSSGFDWKTTHDVTITLIGYANSTVEIANNNGDLIQKAFLKKDETYTVKLNLPVSFKSLQLRYMGQVIDAKIEGNVLTYVFN
jgi:hypothetical protein